MYVKTSKKSLLLVIIAISLCLVITAVELVSFEVANRKDDTFEPMIADFELRMEHFDRTRKLAEKFFADQDVKVKDQYLTIGKTSVQFKEPETQEITFVPITTYQYQSAVRVRDVFQQRYSIRIVQVEDTQVTFQIPEGTYAVIYSTQEEPPKTMMFQGRTVRIKTKEIFDNWYHAVPKYK